LHARFQCFLKANASLLNAALLHTPCLLSKLVWLNANKGCSKHRRQRQLKGKALQLPLVLAKHLYS